MRLVGWPPEGVDGEKISEKAAAQSLKLSPISAYSITRKTPRDGLILGYTAFDEEQIKTGVKKLKAILTTEFSK